MKKMGCMLALLLALVLTVSALGENLRTAEVYDRTADEGALTIRFIDMGEPESGSPGDCAILISPEGQVMMIDAGLSYNREDVLGALEKLGITRIDALVVSHPHGDHTQNMPYIMNHYEVGAVYTSYLENEYTMNYINYMAAIRANGITHVKVAKGDTIPFGDQVKVEVLWPAAEFEYPVNYAEESTQFVNNHSLVLKFSYGESTYLTSGDLYMAGESLVIKDAGEKLDADVMKLNHHGYSTSSGLTWCNTISPEISVVPADSLYNFATYRRLSRKGEVHVTGLEGTVCVRLYPDDSKTVVTERDYDYSAIGL